MHDHGPVLDARVRRHLEERIWPASTTRLATLDVAAAPLTDARASTARQATPGVVGQGEPIPVADGLALDYEPFAIGQAWGPAWGTTWMRFRGQVPAQHRDDHVEAFVDLGATDDAPGFQCEGLVLRADGWVIKGHNPKNQWIPVEACDDGRFEFFIEAASNPRLVSNQTMTPRNMGSKIGAGAAPEYTLRAAELRLVHDDVRGLALDMEALQDVAAQLPQDSDRRWQIRRSLDRALDALELRDIVGSARAARARLSDALATRAADGTHTLHAVGHAHIDTAWLWPLRETRRKVARTVANQIALLDHHPHYRFTLPAAQHVAWLEEDHPELFERLQEAVADGRIIPVGGMWVEADANLPSGEAMCRQFLHGQRYFRSRFGEPCREVWLPDSFGYSAGLPQLAKLAGARWFLTQKISWNQVDAFPHHSFAWEGIDGTRIFTHFPPIDSYNSALGAADLHHAARNFHDKGRSSVSLVPFGYGDGGGGPTREMLERALRVADLEGSPRVELSTPGRFFATAQAEYEALPVWVGELYLELHRGTFTTMSDIKRGNRTAEGLLREAELWCATAHVRGLAEYPTTRLGELWREVLLYQFHDILPGTSISWVNDEVIARLREIAAELETIIADAQHALAAAAGGDDELCFNGAPLPRDGVPAFGAGVPQTHPGRVVVEAVDGGHLIRGEGLTLRVDADGAVRSIHDDDARRELVPPGEAASVLQLHPDLPNRYDAWDIDEAAHHTCQTLRADDIRVIDGGVEIRYSFRDSRASQRITLSTGERRVHVEVEVDWHERDTLLKLAWPFDVHTAVARCEVQMGHITRPTHTNTSWDAQRFEVHAHRWVHVGEPGYGVAIANSCTYGWDFRRVAREGGGTFTWVGASLLKGPQSPDPRGDAGRHHFSFTLRPDAGIEDAVADGYAANHRLRHLTGGVVEPLVSVDGDVLVEALKLAEDGSGDVVLRVREPYGRRAEATLEARFVVSEMVETDLMEEPLVCDDQQQVSPSVLTHVDGSRAALRLRPFQVATIRLRRSACDGPAQ